MKHIQSGKGLVQVLVLVGVLIVLGIFLIPQLTKNGSLMPSNSNTNTNTNTNNQNPAQTAPQGNVSLMLDPASVDTTAGKTFSVAVNIDTKDDTVSATEVHLTFDPNYLEATSVKGGTFLPVLLQQNTGAGTAMIAVGSNPTDPKKGTGTVATVTFTAKKSGSTMISFDKATAVAAIHKTGTVLSSTTGSSVTIK
jgi:hypothetical protein